MSPRAVQLGLASAAGLLLARLLDGLGELPGVSEPAAVRHAALDPRATALGLLACALLAPLTAALAERSRALAAAALVPAQLGLLVGLEEGARSLGAAPHAASGGGESGLWVAAVVQLLLAVLAVGTTVAVLLVVRLPVVAVQAPVPAARAQAPAYRVVVVRRGRAGVRGRAPPAVV